MGTPEPPGFGGEPAQPAETGAVESPWQAGQSEHSGHAGQAPDVDGADAEGYPSPIVAGSTRRPRRARRKDETRHARNLPPDEPAARFADREKPQRYVGGIGQRQPTRPLDPIRPYMAPPVARRRRSDWPVMVFAMVLAAIVMVGCCVAGFALYSGYGNPFAH